MRYLPTPYLTSFDGVHIFLIVRVRDELSQKSVTLAQISQEEVEKRG